MQQNQPNVNAGVWGGLGGAPTFDRGVFFNCGSIHDVQIGRVLLKQSQKSGLGLIVETDILTSRASGEIDYRTHAPYVPLPAQTEGTWWQGMTDRNVALPAVKGFVYAVLGLDPGDPRRNALEAVVPGSENWPANETRRPLAVIESLMLWATGEANILAGYIVHLDTRYLKTQKGQDFTIHNWSPINYQATGTQPPNVDAILAQCHTPPPVPPAQNQGLPPGQWGQPPAQQWPQAPQGLPPGQWGQPPAQQWPQAPQAPQGPPPGQWAPPPNGPPQGPPAQQWGQPPPGQWRQG